MSPGVPATELVVEVESHFDYCGVVCEADAVFLHMFSTYSLPAAA